MEKTIYMGYQWSNRVLFQGNFLRLQGLIFRGTLFRTSNQLEKIYQELFNSWNINRGGVICCWPRVVQYTWSVMGHQTRNCSWRIATTRQLLSVCNMWAIECRPSHLYEYLWCHYFRMRNIVTLVSPGYFCCLRVDMIHHSHPYW